MKSFKTLITYCAALILFSTLPSCQEEPSYDFFLIKVDSINVPDNISTNDSFDIEFYGTIGSNGCHQFSQFKTTEQENNILIEAWGQFDRNTDICPAVMVYFDNEKLNYLIQENGVYTIKIKQPDGNYLEQKISVE